MLSTIIAVAVCWTIAAGAVVLLVHGGATLDPETECITDAECERRHGGEV
jgi:hypothetical protein